MDVPVSVSTSSTNGSKTGSLHPYSFNDKPKTPGQQEQMMHRAEKKYEVGKVSDEEEAKQRLLKSILNKLTPQNFEKLFQQVKQVNIDNVITLAGVTLQIFDKALMEPTMCEMYANFCFHLAGYLPDLSFGNEKITFKRLFLNKCEEEFERGEREEEEANKAEEEGEVKQTAEEREEKRLCARRRMLGSIRLIGELYKKRMLTERIMHECIGKLLGQYQNPDEETIEALCKLMSTIGEMIDHPKAKERMDAYYDIMAKLSNDIKLSSRVRFMLKDAIDLRKNKWQQRRKVESPKKTEEVHRDVAQERVHDSGLGHAPSMGNSSRKGPPMDFGARSPSMMLPSTNSYISGFPGSLPQLQGYGSQDVDVRTDERHSSPPEGGVRSENETMTSSTAVGYMNNAVGFRPGHGGNHGVLRNPRAHTPQYAGGILSGLMQSLGPAGGPQRNNVDSDRWRREAGYQKGLMSYSHSPKRMMHRAEKKYEVGKVSDEEEAKQRLLKSILNKLTPQNFEKLFQQVKQVNIDNVITLAGFILQIFDKALMEPALSEMYANFCFHLALGLPDLSVDNEKITFKRLLLNKCQEEFERGERQEEVANKAEEEGEVKRTAEEREEKRLCARRRMLGNIRLIGELYKKRMLTERIMHECIGKLLGQYQNPDEENIEALCKLMSTIGEMIDHPKAKELMDAYYDIMSKLSNDIKLSSRVRFMLKDAIDLRKNKWQQRRKVESPKKIKEVHRDVAQERVHDSRLGHAPSMGNYSRRGPLMDFGARPPSMMLPSTNSHISGFPGSLPQLQGYGSQDVDVRSDERHSSPPEGGVRSENETMTSIAAVGYMNNAVGFRPGHGGNHGVLRNPRAHTPQYAGGILSGLMQSLGPAGGPQRNNVDSDRWRREAGYQKGLMSYSHSPKQMMHRAEKKYEVGKVSDEEEAKQRLLKSILNKLTPQNFEKLFQQVKQVNIDNVITLAGFILQIFDKALMEPALSEMYANFCFLLALGLPDLSVDNEKITFKRLLLNKCQEEFERGERQEEVANKAEEEGEVKRTAEEREEKRLCARRRMLGNIRLIGELYKKRMLTERIMHECIGKLLGQYQNPEEENIEALCKLMSTIGEMIDHPKAKDHMDAYYDIMAKLSNDIKLSSRVRFMLKDAIDLRKNKWQQRRKIERPKKIEEVHRDAGGILSGLMQFLGPPGGPQRVPIYRIFSSHACWGVKRVLLAAFIMTAMFSRWKWNF